MKTTVTVRRHCVSITVYNTIMRHSPVLVEGMHLRVQGTGDGTTRVDLGHHLLLAQHRAELVSPVQVEVLTITYAYSTGIYIDSKFISNMGIVINFSISLKLLYTYITVY